MENKNLIILFGLAVILILAGIITAMSLNDNSNKNNTTNESLNLTTNDTENFTDNSTSKETQSNDKSSPKSSTSLDVEEQEFEYTRDQPTKNVDGVDYKLMYGEDNKPTHWQSTDGQNTELPLKKNSKRSSSNSYSTSSGDSSE